MTTTTTRRVLTVALAVGGYAAYIAAWLFFRDDLRWLWHTVKGLVGI